MVDIKRILVPTDFSDSSEQALEVAIDLATRYQASLTLFHAVELPLYGYPGMTVGPIDVLTPVQEAAQRQLDATLAALRKRLPSVQAVLRIGVPWSETLDCAREVRADLIVMGTHGRRGFERALLGSVAEKIVRTSPVPVLTVRGAK